jgi:CheY-like chemotaxis protein
MNRGAVLSVAFHIAALGSQRHQCRSPGALPTAGPARRHALTGGQMALDLPMALRHVLVVDDQPTVRLMLRKFLETADYRVTEASNAEAAFATVKSDPPDIILLDLKMPGLDGHDVLRTLKADKAFKIPVMVLTGELNWIDVDASVGEGADAYMTKPVTRDQLLVKVEELLGPNQ